MNIRFTGREQAELQCATDSLHVKGIGIQGGRNQLFFGQGFIPACDQAVRRGRRLSDDGMLRVQVGE